MVGSMRDRVEALVSEIPPGRVITYGDLAAACGYPGAARRVGAIAAAGGPDLPWHRVVRAGGRLARVSGVSPTWQGQALAAEGVSLVDDRVANFETVGWYPELVV
jgi:methylated-DNA-protein-cysteine methyltransferase-like protein